MATGADLLDYIDDFYGEVDDVEKTRHLVRSHNRLRRIVPLTTSIVTFSSLVADTREYATGDSYMKVWSARYVRSATEGDSKILTAISVDELDLDFDNWRAQGSSEPEYWYWRSGNLGFHNKPDTSTSGGYPNVSLEVSTTETFTTSITLPAHVSHYEAWMFDAIYAMCVSRQDWEAAAHFKQLKAESLAELIKMTHDRTARYVPRQRANMESYGVERV